MKTIKLTPAVSNKPCDIEYRLKRAAALASECAQFLEGIDTNTPIGDRLVEAIKHAHAASTEISEMRAAAPPKRIHGKKAKAAAGIVDEPKVKKVKAPKAAKPAKAAKAPKGKASQRLSAELATLDEALNAALDAAATTEHLVATPEAAAAE